MVKTKVRPPARHRGGSISEEPPFLRYRRDEGGEQPYDPASSARLGMYIFLGALLMMFGAIALVFLLRLPVRDAFPFDLPKTTWVSTAILLISSVACQYALNCARQDHARGVITGLTLTLAMGLLFLGLQGVSWLEIARQIGHTGNNVFTGLFYVFTAIHGFHLVGGIVFVGWLLASVMRLGLKPSHLLPIELGTLYWHFMDLVWLMLFGVMLIR